MLDQKQAVERSYEIPGQTWPAELCWLYDTLRDSKSHAEVGVYCGRSLFASCGGMAEASVYAVDVEEPSCPSVSVPGPHWLRAVQDLTLAAISTEHPTIRIQSIRATSLDAARMLQARAVILDSVFIDAGHEYESVTGDIQAWRTLVKPGGTICGHDFWPAHIGVMRAVHENFERFEIVPNTRIWFARN